MAWHALNPPSAVFVTLTTTITRTTGRGSSRGLLQGGTPRAARARGRVARPGAIWATPALPTPPTTDTKPAAFPGGAHRHLCVGTGREGTAAQQLHGLRHSRGQQVARSATSYGELRGSATRVSSRKRHLLDSHGWSCFTGAFSPPRKVLLSRLL